MSVQPLRIYRTERGIWHAEIYRDGEVMEFSLRTRDEAKAREKWQEYINSVKLREVERGLL